MKVYVVSVGSNCEDGRDIKCSGVYTNIDSAREKLKELAEESIHEFDLRCVDDETEDEEYSAMVFGILYGEMEPEESGIYCVLNDDDFEVSDYEDSQNSIFGIINEMEVDK